MIRKEVLEAWKSYKEKVHQKLERYRTCFADCTFEFNLFSHVKSQEPSFLRGEYNIIKSDNYFTEAIPVSHNPNIGYMNSYSYRVRGIVTEFLGFEWIDNVGKRKLETICEPPFPVAEFKK